jgi:hypothetical protein
VLALDNGRRLFLTQEALQDESIGIRQLTGRRSLVFKALCLDNKREQLIGRRYVALGSLCSERFDDQPTLGYPAGSPINGDAD